MRTVSRSSGVSSRKGTLVRTPIFSAISFISDHIRVCQGSTAPSLMERLSSGTREDSSTTRTMPVPSQLEKPVSPTRSPITMQRSDAKMDNRTSFVFSLIVIFPFC